VKRFDRPVPGGISVSNADFDRGEGIISAGTLGCLVVRKNGHRCILSNSHVLAGAGQATAGQRIIQPGGLEFGRQPTDPEIENCKVAFLEEFTRIQFPGFGGTSPQNSVDAAVAWTSHAAARPEVLGYTLQAVPRLATARMTVRKTGRTTGTTIGIVEGINVSMKVRYEGGVALFVNQLQIRGANGPFARRGDSGSLVVSEQDKSPVGL